MRGGGGEGGVSWESVVGPLLVEEPLEVAATARGESLEKKREREREREVCGLNVLRHSCCTFLPNVRIFSADLLTLGGR